MSLSAKRKCLTELLDLGVTDQLSWTNSGAPFTTTGNTMDYPQSWDVDSWDKLFFRVQPIP